jgi:hypothetical protein
MGRAMWVLHNCVCTFLACCTCCSLRGWLLVAPGAILGLICSTLLHSLSRQLGPLHMQRTKCSSSGELVLLLLPPVPSVHSSDYQIELKHHQQSQYIAHCHMLDEKSCFYKTGGESLPKRAFPTRSIRGVATKARVVLEAKQTRTSKERTSKERTKSS